MCCLSKKVVRRYQEIMKLIYTNKKITKDDYEFLKKYKIPVDQLRLEEYVSY